MTISAYIVQKGRWIASPSARNDETRMPRERILGLNEELYAY